MGRGRGARTGGGAATSVDPPALGRHPQGEKVNEKVGALFIPVRTRRAPSEMPRTRRSPVRFLAACFRGCALEYSRPRLDQPLSITSYRRLYKTDSRSCCSQDCVVYKSIFVSREGESPSVAARRHRRSYVRCAISPFDRSCHALDSRIAPPPPPPPLTRALHHPVGGGSFFGDGGNTPTFVHTAPSASSPFAASSLVTSAGMSTT